MMYFLGIDIGTTSAKAVAFSKEGEVVASHSISYDMQHPEPTWSEQDPEEIFSAVIQSLNEVLTTLSPVQPAFISFSAAMHSLIVMDEKGKTLTPCIIWADNRAHYVAEKIRATSQGYRFYQSSGVPVHSMSPMCKIAWLKENDPSTFSKAAKFIGIKEFIFFKLFGEFVSDTSIASATGLLNTMTLRWDKEILDFLEISEEKLPRLVSTKSYYFYNGGVSGLSISPNVPFVIGASDGSLSNLGTGAVGKTMAITIGTSGAARLVMPKPQVDEKMRIFCYHLKDDLYIAGGGNNNGAVVLQWLKENILVSDEDYSELFDLANNVEAGSEGLLFLPYILGERAPLWNSNAKGVLFGLSIQHTKAHIIRAAIEGVVYCMYSIGSILMEKSEVNEIHASGGFAKSDLWLQILADVMNTKVLVADTVESSALGAVVLGAEAMNMDVSLSQKFPKEFTPNPENHQVYKKQFNKFENLYELLKTQMVIDNESKAKN